MTEPVPKDDSTRRRLSAQRRRDTGPELALRSRLHARGLRYRVDLRPLKESRCRADLVFSRSRVAVFVDGCFWHGCPEHGTIPQNNRAWWESKLSANVARDRRFDSQLVAAGWTPLRIWEHQDMDEAAAFVEAFVRAGVTSAPDRAL